MHLLKISVCRKTETHKKLFAAASRLWKKNVCMLKFSNPPHSRPKNNGPSVISSVPFGDSTKFIYRLGILYMMAKKIGEEELSFQNNVKDWVLFASSQRPLNKIVVTMEARQCVIKRFEDAVTQSFAKWKWLMISKSGLLQRFFTWRTFCKHKNS